MIEVRLRLEDYETVRRELLELLQQEGRLRLIEAGVVPGARAEVDEQLRALRTSAAREWLSFARRQRSVLHMRGANAVLKGAQELGFQGAHG
jgi:hypothetical protein